MRMPEEITKYISQRAVEIARNLAPKKTGAGAASLVATSYEGEIGISIPDQYIYMLFQDQGTKPRIMYELAGRTIPIRNANGTINFRRATEDNIGRRRITARNEKGQIVKSKITWRHPGIRPQYFIERSLRQATREWVMSANGQTIMSMLDRSDVDYLIDILRGRD